MWRYYRETLIIMHGHVCVSECVNFIFKRKPEQLVQHSNSWCLQELDTLVFYFEDVT